MQDDAVALHLLGQSQAQIRVVSGALQFEVVKFRLESEYNVKTLMTTLPFALARRVVGDSAVLASAQLPSNAKLVEDWGGAPLALFESEWSMRLAGEWNPKLTFAPFGGRGTVVAAS